MPLKGSSSPKLVNSELLTTLSNAMLLTEELLRPPLTSPAASLFIKLMSLRADRLPRASPNDALFPFGSTDGGGFIEVGGFMPGGSFLLPPDPPLLAAIPPLPPEAVELDACGGKGEGLRW